MKEKNKLDMSKVIGTEKKQLNSRNDTLHPHKPKIIVQVFFICYPKLVKTLMFSILTP